VTSDSYPAAASDSAHRDWPRRGWACRGWTRRGSGRGHTANARPLPVRSGGIFGAM